MRLGSLGICRRRGGIDHDIHHRGRGMDDLGMYHGKGGFIVVVTVKIEDWMLLVFTTRGQNGCRICRQNEDSRLGALGIYHRRRRFGLSIYC